MRVQRTRRPSLRSGRSGRSLGSPLTRYPLGSSSCSQRPGTDKLRQPRTASGRRPSWPKQVEHEW